MLIKTDKEAFQFFQSRHVKCGKPLMWEMNKTPPRHAHVKLAQFCVCHIMGSLLSQWNLPPYGINQKKMQEIIRSQWLNLTPLKALTPNMLFCFLQLKWRHIWRGIGKPNMWTLSNQIGICVCVDPYICRDVDKEMWCTLKWVFVLVWESEPECVCIQSCLTNIIWSPLLWSSLIKVFFLICMIWFRKLLTK